MNPVRSNKFPVILLLIGLTGCQINTVKDIDGNKYKTIKIGTQIWMAEDLKTTRYNDGTTIPVVTNYDDWAALSTPACCWYNNDSANNETYGILYNWYAVNTNKLCPEGWHVPTDEEWNELLKYIRESGSAGGALKEAGTSHWRSPNTGATNESGFTALPGGYRSYNGTFNLLRARSYWWSSTESNWWSLGDSSLTIAFYRYIHYNENNIYRYVGEKSNGLYVRCLMDQ